MIELSTMTFALVAFACGAVAGIVLAVRHFLRKKLPVSVALFHGVGGAIGFTLVLLTVVHEPEFRPARDALYLFIATIALGCVNLLFHIRRVRHRNSLIVMHALTAVSGVVTLIYAIVVHAPDADARTENPTSAATSKVGAEKAALSATAAPTNGVPPTAAQATVVEPPTAPSALAPTAERHSEPAKTAASVDELITDPTVRKALVHSIKFATNGSAIDSQSAIAALAKVLVDHPEITVVEVQGHADERGPDTVNVDLTRQRAAAVAEALVALGVDRSRLRTAGYGARCSADSGCRRSDAPPSCHTAESWDRDRRVVVVPLEVGAKSLRGEVVCAQGQPLIPEADQPFQTPRPRN